MEREVDEVVGPKGNHNPDRSAKRHAHENVARGEQRNENPR
jgi:hypothetical protein